MGPEKPPVPRRTTDPLPGRVTPPPVADPHAESLNASFDLLASRRRTTEPFRPLDDGQREQHGPAARPSNGESPPRSGVVVPPHHPAAAREVEERSLPTVIIDLDGDLGRVVDRIASGEADEAAEAELLHYGERAMPAVMQRFPGPITFDRSRIASMTHPPRASECGPVLRLVARERKVALPFVLDRLTSPDVETRGWATYLLAELPYAEAIPRLIERLRDDDPSIRVAAARAISAIARSFSEQVSDALKDLARSTDARSRAASSRAMGEVRDPWVVPELTAGLRDAADDVAVAAHDALVLVTRQDFGRDPRPWLRWWDQNGRRHRIEWLIDALTHEVSEIRRASGEELRAVSRQYFGYASELPPRDRERAQQRYRDWWITEGRARQRHS
jgi:HEAT repeat protein